MNIDDIESCEGDPLQQDRLEVAAKP
jgi:hypothetical protein